MKKTVLAAVSALALSFAFAPAMAGTTVGVTDAAVGIGSGSTASGGGTALSNGSYSDLSVVSKNDLSAHFGGTTISFSAAAAAGNGGSGGSLSLANGGNGGNGGAAAGSLNDGSISQDGNAFQNFAGINTMTQSTAPYNNNQAATSVAAYSPVGFGTGSATVH